MDLDLETFLITLYVMTDDWYNKSSYQATHMRRTGAQVMRQRSVVPGAIAAQWRSGVPWQTERGFVRYALKHLRPFSGIASQSAFNRRVRRLWGAFILCSWRSAVNY